MPVPPVPPIPAAADGLHHGGSPPKQPAATKEGTASWRRSLARTHKDLQHVRSVRLLDHHEVTPYYRTPFLLRGYRPHLSVSQAFCSVLRHHNETLNMLTHLIGAALFFMLFFAEMGSIWMSPSMLRDGEESPWLPAAGDMPLSPWWTRPMQHLVASFYAPLATGDAVLVAAAPLGCGIMCLCSVFFHTVGCCSERHYKGGMQTDGCGILMCMGLCQILPMWFMWQCFPMERAVHMTVQLALLVGCVLVVFLPQFHEIRFRRIRALLFGLGSFFWCISMVRLSWRVSGSLEFMLQFDPVWSLLERIVTGVLFLGFGASLILNRIPERWFPGRLDYGWWSHPIWHVCVVLQGLAHYLLYRDYAVSMTSDTLWAEFCPILTAAR